MCILDKEWLAKDLPTNVKNIGSGHSGMVENETDISFMNTCKYSLSFSGSQQTIGMSVCFHSMVLQNHPCVAADLKAVAGRDIAEMMMGENID